MKVFQKKSIMSFLLSLVLASALFLSATGCRTIPDAKQTTEVVDSETQVASSKTDEESEISNSSETESNPQSASESESRDAGESTAEPTIEETSTESEPREYTEYLQRNDWNPRVKKALNDLIYFYGAGSEGYPSNPQNAPYAVFDFDNTISIFDVEEQLIIYQLQHMNFSVTKEELIATLSVGLNLDRDVTALGYGKGTYRAWISDISEAYGALIQKFGPFTAEGLSEEASKTIQSDDDWKAFATKMRALYSLVFAAEGTEVAYPWVTYWFQNMTPLEVYEMAAKSHETFSKVKTSTVVWQVPAQKAGQVGAISYAFTQGISVSENMKELIKALCENGIAVYICSASQRDVVRAAVDVFGLHDYVSGVFALVNQMVGGKYTAEYNYVNGRGYLRNGAGWQEDTMNINALTVKDGKVTAIQNALVSRYGHGPMAGFMDNKGDFNFCTEFSSLKLVVCMNRSNQNITDGGALIGAIALYQEQGLGYDLQTANENGDTLYVFQGRDESGLRGFRASERTIVYDRTDSTTSEKLFATGNSEKQLNYMMSHKMSTKAYLELFAISTPAGSSGNVLGVDYGFIQKNAPGYPGYHVYQ